MLSTTSKGNHELLIPVNPNISTISKVNYIWYIGSKELNSTYSYVVCAKSKEEALKIDPYPEHDFSVPETVICIGIASSEMKCGEVICASFNHLLRIMN